MRISRRKFLLASSTSAPAGLAALSQLASSSVQTPRLSGATEHHGVINMILAEQPATPVVFGIGELRRAIEQRGLRILTRSQTSATKVDIFLGQQGDPHLARVDKSLLVVPDVSESYALALIPPNSIAVVGSDGTGAMYGALDLAEQFAWTSGSDLMGQIKPVSKSPYLQIRGVNLFITTQDLDQPGGAFWSDSYWTGLLEMMARARYNFLDIHGPCDAVTLTFPNGYSYFVNLPDFPKVGVGPGRALENMRRFRQVVRMAADHGIKVGYMNYEAAPPIGPWKSRKYGTDERWEPKSQDFLNGPRLEEYTRQAVAKFLRQVPELWMFGFRLGESGQPEDFYKRTYLPALKDAPASLNLYVRTWQADPQKVRELASATNRRFFIEIKYNGEQLGLPYQAVLGGREYPPSGSYEDYTNYPRNYSIIWQIRAHGTHRVFYWGSPEFARRTASSCKFGDGVGFSMEPMDAYCPAADYLHNNPKTDHSFYKWMFEREWLWHLIWGRTAYDPEVSDRVWLSEFERRFGSRPGSVIYKALVESSKIVPLICAYHNVGLDHQFDAPEFENGDHALEARFHFWQGERLVPLGGNNEDFLRVRTLDRTAMADPVTYVDERLSHTPSGKMTPFEVADYLGSAADKSENEIQEAARLLPGSPKEFDCIRKDIEAIAWLARYHRDRILSVTHLEFYQRTYHHPELSAAFEYLQRAVEDWDRFSDVTEQHFGFVPEYIRMGFKRFRWRDEGRYLGVDLDQINNLEAEFRQLAGENWWAHRAIIGHVPPLKARPGQPLRLTVTYATGSKASYIFLFYRNSQQTIYTRSPLKLANEFERTWSGEIPAEEVAAGHVQYYFEANQGVALPYVGTLEDRPPYDIFVNENDSKPVINHFQPVNPGRGESVALTAEVQARAPIRFVRVYYKVTPSYYEWLSLEMQKAGENQYSASVPLTPQGILYYFEAIDEDGNAVDYPNFLNQTPYFVIEAWNPARS